MVTGPRHVGLDLKSNCTNITIIIYFLVLEKRLQFVPYQFTKAERGVADFLN